MSDIPSDPAADLAVRVRAALEDVRPMLRADGGDIEFVSANPETGRVEVRLRGACRHCAASLFTMTYSVEAQLKRAIPSIQKVVAI